MADISGLTGLLETEPLDLPNYKANQEFRLPPAGKYTVRVREQFPTDAFGSTQAGYLSASVDPTIVGGPFDGYTIKFTKLSAKPWEDRKGRTQSQVIKFLKACGVNDVISGKPQDVANAIEQTAGTLLTVKLEWRAYNKNSGYEVIGMENFPMNGDGTHATWIEDPNDFDDKGEPTRLRANVFVDRFFPLAR